MHGVRLALPVALMLSLLVCAGAACLTHPLFGGGATYSFSGTPENAPIPPWVPSENDSPAATGLGAHHHPPDAGPDHLAPSAEASVDSRSTDGGD